MALENKKLKNNKKDYKLNNQTIEDKQDSNRNDIMTRTIIGGLAIAGSVAMYKTGFLREAVGSLKELGAAFAEMGSSNTYHTSKAIKDWSYGRTEDMLRPSKSIFNSIKDTSAGYDIWKDLKESFKRGEIYSANTKRIINDTVEDINILKQMIQKETKGYSEASLQAARLQVEEELAGRSEKEIEEAIQKRTQEIINSGQEFIKKRNTSVTRSSIVKNIHELNTISAEATRNNLRDSSNKVSNELISRFLTKNSLSDEQKLSQLKHTTYREFTLGDIFDSFDFDSHKLIFKNELATAEELAGKNEEEIEKIYINKVKELYKIDLSESVNKKGDSVKSFIEDFLSNPAYKYQEGEKLGTIGIFDNVWKRMVIDPRININKTEDKVINYMMGQEALEFYATFLRKDLKLPVLGFNPIDSAIKVTPLDKILNNRDVSFALVNGVNNYSSYISGYGTRAVDDINTALQKRFDKPDETFHLLFADHDLYALGTKGTKEFIGSGYNLYDITDADKGFKLPHEVEIMRQMGGYDLNRNPMKEVLEEFGHHGTDFNPNMTIEQYENTFGIKMTAPQKLKYEIGRHLDIGYQEFRARLDNDYFDFGEFTNIDNFFDEIIDKVMHSNAMRTNGFQFENYEAAAEAIRDKTYSMAFGEGFKDFIDKEGTLYKSKTYALIKQGIGIKTLIEDTKANDMEAFEKDFTNMFKQYFIGFDKNYKMDEAFTENSIKLYDVFNALDSGLASIRLGLSLDSKRSAGALMKNLLFKRALPAYMLTQVPGMIDYFSEPLFTNKKEKEEGKTDTLTKTLMRDVVKPIDIGVHGIGDTLGFTKIFKYLQEMTPGSDQINELPLIYQLGLGQTKEERKEYIEKGYDPIRKNRYWTASNTPFTGSKIDHWRPNIYRRIEADIKFSDSMYGSRKEYYQNTWYPNLVSPLAPIRHFITDPHHWDKKHYNDRPYAEIAPKGENIPLIGPLVSGTIGQVYRKKMHKEYWNEDGALKPVNPEDEKPSQLLMTGTSSNIDIPKRNPFSDMYKVIERAFVDTETFNKINANAQEQYHKAANQRIIDIAKAMFITKPQHQQTFEDFKNTPLYDNAIKSFTTAYNPTTTKPLPYILDNDKLFTKAKEYSSPLQTSSLPYRDYNKYNTALDVYITPSGGINVVDVPENLNLYKVNEEIKHYSLNKIYGTNQRVDIQEYDRGYEEEEISEIKNDVAWNIGREFNDIADIYGLKGFMIQTLFTGEMNVGSTKVENSGYAYSANRTFWDQNLGGLGGELSEISRRFIHKKDKDTTYLNPIRNTMPTWMPGSNYFTDFLHGDPYSKIMNGEERLPGEGYERLNDINFSLNISSSMLGNSRAAQVKHFLQQDTNLTYEDEEQVKKLRRGEEEKEIIGDQYKIQNLNQVEEFVSRILDHFREADILIDSKIKFHDEQNDITGMVDAKIKDYHSRTGETLINIRGVDEKEFNRLKSGNDIRNQDYYEMNYDLYTLNNTKGRGYVYYYNNENPDDIYKARVKFNKKDLRSSIKNLNDSRLDIYKGLKSGEISRGDLYPLIEKYKILADTAPYSQEFKDISSQVSHAHLTESQKKEVKAAKDRMQEQKQPFRLYDYKFKTANLKSENVTVKKIIDNNTIIVNEYGKEHAIKFAGINVSESNTNLYAPTVKDKKVKSKETGRMRTIKTGKTMNEAANDEIRKYLKPGKRITIQYDADERNKYSKDSTQSIRAIVNARGTNLNRRLVKKGLAKEKESDESAAGIHAKYSKGSIAFGSMMESLSHGAANLPFIGDKFFHIRSPYEEYRKREVYNKDFKSWNHPIRDYVIPTVEDLSSQNPISGIMIGAFIGNMAGRGPYGRLMGTIIGGAIPAVGQVVHALGSNKDHEWRPKRRRQQEEMNTYLDTLKYVKSMKLYNKYKDLAKKNDHFDVEKYIEKQEKHGKENKERKQELNNYKRLVKLDFKHRGNYNFKYGEPKYEEKGQSKKEVIRAINRELSEIGNDRKVEKLPLNAIKAISYKQASEQTMYGYDAGDDVRNIMTALPKKERQYYSKLVNAPEEEKQKILRIAPSYLRRALQASWGMHVDEKPDLKEYFTKHALPDENWAGWQEDVDLENVKVKMVNQNGLDPGEYDIWTNNKNEADKINIPIPKLRVKNNPNAVQAQLTRMLGKAGLDNVQVSYTKGIGNQRTRFNIKEDSREEVDRQIKNLNYA